MRRRLDLAASLLGQPSVLFLDEPTTGLDPQSRLTLWGIISELVSAGTTLLLTTQYLDEADRLADRICVIDGGRVTAEGSPAELKARVGTALPAADRRPPPPSLTRVAERDLRLRGRSGPAAGRHRGLEIPVVPRPGLVTEVVRTLDAAGIDVDDIAVRQPSLDDVFPSLTRAGGGMSAVACGPPDLYDRGLAEPRAWPGRLRRRPTRAGWIACAGRSATCGC